MALLEVAHFERQRINVRGVADGRMGVLFFDKVTPSCQDICCREIYVTSLKYPFIINAFLIETKSRNKSVSLQRHILILPIFWQKTLFFSRVHADLFFFLWWRSTKKNIQKNNHPWWNPHQPSSPTKKISCGFPGHGVFPGILLLQGGGGRGEKDFKGLERWDEHPAAE